VAMTGEITLRGLVLPIGGLKEKTLAAKRAGIKHVIVPKRNEKDFPDLPEEVRDTLTFHFVERVDEAMKVALGDTSHKEHKRAEPARRQEPAKRAENHRRTNAGRAERVSASTDGRR